MRRFTMYSPEPMGVQHMKRDLGRVSAVGGLLSGLYELAFVAKTSRGVFVSALVIVLSTLLVLFEFQEIIGKHAPARVTQRVANFVEDLSLYLTMRRAVVTFLAALFLATREDGFSNLWIGFVVVLLVAQTVSLVLASELVGESVRTAQGYRPVRRSRDWEGGDLLDTYVDDDDDGGAEETKGDAKNVRFEDTELDLRPTDGAPRPADDEKTTPSKDQLNVDASVVTV